MSAGTARRKTTRPLTAAGVALLDYDGDGRLDIYFATTRSFPLDAPTTSRGNKLYRNRGDGTFEDVTERAGVGFRGFCQGVAAGDVDNDGDPDLLLTNFGPNVLYLNDGDGTFHEAEGLLPSRGPAVVVGGRLPRLRWRRRAGPLHHLLRPMDLRGAAPVLRRREPKDADVLLADTDDTRAALPLPQPGRRHASRT